LRGWAIISTIMDGEIDNRVNTGPTGAAPQIRALHLRYPEMSHAQIADRVGCHRSNVYRVLDRFLSDDVTEGALREYQDNRANVWDAITLRALMSINDTKLAKSSASALMMVAGIAHDKSQALRGEATSIDVHVLVDAVRQCRDMRRSGA